MPGFFGVSFGGLATLAAVVAACGLLLAAAAVSLMARALLRPPRMTDGKAAWVLKRLSPGDLGLAYEELTFDVRDERSARPLRIKAWWIPAAGASDRCAVLLHGYADAKVGAIAWAPLWHDPGFNVLAVDLRAHGESGGAESTAGFFERHDLGQVLDQMRAERPRQTRRVVLFGVSLGAAVAAAVAADTESGVDALVLESPIVDFRTAARAHMDAMGLPAGAFQRAALWLAERMSGARFDEVRTADSLRKARCPVMVIATAGDVFNTAAEERALEEAVNDGRVARGPRVFWRVEGVPRLMAASALAGEYRQRLGAFLAPALDASQTAAAPVPPPGGVNAAKSSV